MPNFVFSPDKSRNPFCFFFKNKKIETDSGNYVSKNPFFSSKITMLN